jgi:hypothetical protein
VRPRAALALTAALAVAAPLAGLALEGRPLAPYLAFPPRTALVEHAPFSWLAFALFAPVIVAALALFAFAVLKATPQAGMRRRAFPSWGWAGLAVMVAGWVLAWKEGLVPQDWRRHMFSVLWLGYIVAMNALVVRRGGEAPLLARPRWFLTLFPASAVLWWLFEYLNQFTANWHYAGSAAKTDLAYFVQATLPFATVLPALASTEAWLRTFARLDALSLFAVRGGRTLRVAAFVAGTAALAALPLAPQYLFPMLWVAPALVLGALYPRYFAPLASADWRPVLLPAAAALACGFFWELWNWGSLARWRYSIPFVQRFQLFEMPLLGYGGYLPFGVACALVMDALGQRSASPRPRSSA